MYDNGFDYNYVLDGSGVDVVVMDTGIQADHPEWENEFGVSRLIELDWYAASGVSGSLPSGFYTDVNGHGTHCAGTMAGKNFGWAKNALIFSLTTYGNTGNSISFEDAVDCLIGWHNSKPINPATGFKRPTVVNMSFQYSWYLDTSTVPNKVSSLSSGGLTYDVTGGKYRGVTHSDTERIDLRAKGVTGTSRGRYMFGRKMAAKDADVEQLLANGIHVCTAAGNNYMKIDHPGGPDYNNQLTINRFGFTDHIYYHRGASPATFEGGSTWTGSEEDFETNYIGAIVSPAGSPSFNDGFEVGALDNTALFRSGRGYLDRKSAFSDSGPGVDIYAAGESIISSCADADSGVEYFYGQYTGSPYKQTKKSGTSMATPQVVGMIACLLQAHPDWSPKQVKSYLLNNSQDIMYETINNDNDYTTTTSIHGGNNRIAYFPLSGSKTFEITSN